VKGKFENIQSLRWHYPDQVRGYDLSRFWNGTPWFSAAKVQLFLKRWKKHH